MHETEQTEKDRRVSPSLAEVESLAAAGDYARVPVACEILSDVASPIECLRRLQRVSGHCYLLESAEPGAPRGRWTFLGFDPSLELSCRGAQTHVRVGDDDESFSEPPAQVIRRVLAEHRAPRVGDMPPFAGGLVGYFSFEYFAHVEPTALPDVPDDGDDEGFNDVDLMLFERVVAYDSYRQKIVLVANVDVSDKTRIAEAYDRACADLACLQELVEHGEPAAPVPGRMTSPLTPRFDEAAYCDMVEAAKHHIQEGDIFQVVLSDRLAADFEGSLLDCYRVLRTTNPSPYLFYLASADLELAGASPETLVKLEDGVLHTFPLAGSRPRGATPEADEALATELLADEKELAEHNMLVDLGRNDLGRISEFGSVAVERHLDVQRYSHIMHLASSVRGRIRDGLDALDAVGSLLPAGTLSGAPKIRACQIIRELEGDRRGIYGGTVGYLDLTGNLDVCIGIRLAYHRGGRVYVRAGAGIVADSVPEKEYQECHNKARAVVEALEVAQGGLA